jgi:hypothetical protein
MSKVPFAEVKMTKLEQEMQSLYITPSAMLNRINSIAERDVREEAQMKYPGQDSKSVQLRAAYVREHKKKDGRGNHAINAVIGVTRKTLYNAIKGNYTAGLSPKTANYIIQVINDTRLSRGLTRITLNDLDITVYKRWEQK